MYSAEKIEKLARFGRLKVGTPLAIIEIQIGGDVMAEQKIAVLGAEPEGVVISALLTRRGVIIDLIGAKSDYVKAMQQKNTTIVGSLDIRIPISTYTPEQVSGQYDVVFLMGPSCLIRERLEEIQPYLHKKSIICALLGASDDVAPLEKLENEQLIAGVVSVEAEWVEPGTVCCISSAQHLVYGPLFELSEFDGRITPRLLRVQKILEKAGYCLASHASLGGSKVHQNSNPGIIALKA